MPLLTVAVLSFYCRIPVVLDIDQVEVSSSSLSLRPPQPCLLAAAGVASHRTPGQTDGLRTLLCAQYLLDQLVRLRCSSPPALRPCRPPAFVRARLSSSPRPHLRSSSIFPSSTMDPVYHLFDALSLLLSKGRMSW